MIAYSFHRINSGSSFDLTHLRFEAIAFTLIMRHFIRTGVLSKHLHWKGFQVYRRVVEDRGSGFVRAHIIAEQLPLEKPSLTVRKRPTMMEKDEEGFLCISVQQFVV